MKYSLERKRDIDCNVNAFNAKLRLKNWTESKIVFKLTSDKDMEKQILTPLKTGMLFKPVS